MLAVPIQRRKWTRQWQDESPASNQTPSARAVHRPMGVDTSYSSEKWIRGALLLSVAGLSCWPTPPSYCPRQE